MQSKPTINVNPILSWKNSNGKDYSYTVTSVDKISLFRACAFEGKPQYAVCWTLLQRFAFLYPKFKNINSFVKEYVQPINPRWFIDGSKHISYVARLQKQYEGQELIDKLKDAERRAILRKKHASAEIDSKEYISIVENIFDATIESPGGEIIHYCASFASPHITEQEAQKEAIVFGNKRGMIAVDFGQSFLPGTNWFFKISKSVNFKLRIT